MKQNERQLDAIEIPQWLAQSCDNHRIINLSDTRTYRLLLAIFQTVISATFSANDLESAVEEDMRGFTNWFLRLGNSIEAYVGLMWVYQELGMKALTTNAKFSDDRRLSDIWLTFIVLTNQGDDDPLTERYHGLIGDGWETGGPDDFKDSLYQGLKATLTTHAYRELVTIGKTLNLTESETKKSLRFLANKARSEQQRGHSPTINQSIKLNPESEPPSHGARRSSRRGSGGTGTNEASASRPGAF